MAIRKDGAATRQRILDAACVEFGEKGYHDATHAAICTRAGANIAAINYHFGSKEALYRAVWEQAFQLAEELYPLDGGVAPDAPPEDRLAALLHALIHRHSDQDRLDYFHDIRMREMFNPTGLLDDLIHHWITETQHYLQGVLHEMLGENATREDVVLCELSIIAPILLGTDPMKHHKMAERNLPPPPWAYISEHPEQLLEHSQTFIMAGLERIRTRIASRQNVSETSFSGASVTLRKKKQ
jgi:TetR/AcrR family transcriptional regulator, regulator of cefoperazone and chloramphenicol sensitivity